MSARDGHLRLERKQKDMADKVKEGKVRCSFCHKTEDQVRKLIAGPDGAYICDECIGICSEIMEEEFSMYDHEADYETGINLLKPEEIHSILDEYVIGIGVSNTPLIELLAQNGCDVTACEDRKSTRLNSSHVRTSRMPSSA